MSLLALQGTVELGIIYALMALGVFISFRTLNMPDLTVDSSFTLGAAVSAMLCTMGHPFLAIPAAMVAGCFAGNVTALLHQAKNSAASGWHISHAGSLFRKLAGYGWSCQYSAD